MAAGTLCGCSGSVASVFFGASPAVGQQIAASVAELARTQTDDPDAIEAFVALSDGLCAAILLNDDEADGGRVRVALTRDEDAHLTLGQRALLARRLGASLYVSLHMDSAPNPLARGASVYSLSEVASDAEAARLAETINAGGNNVEQRRVLSMEGGNLVIESTGWKRTSGLVGTRLKNWSHCAGRIESPLSENALRVSMSASRASIQSTSTGR